MHVEVNYSHYQGFSKVPDKFFSALLKMYWTSNQDTWILTGLFLIYYDFGKFIKHFCASICPSAK